MALFRKLANKDFEALHSYLNELSVISKSRFGPHGFEINDIVRILSDHAAYKGYIAVNEPSGEIIGYTIVKMGYLDHDAPRLIGHGFYPNHETDCTLAPSVADAWQGKGLGSQLFKFVASDLQLMRIERIILWGGVQAHNPAAIALYKKFGFREIGRFEYHSENLDMVLDLLPQLV